MSFWSDIATKLEDLKDQSLHPVYSSAGRHVGYFTSDQELAAGRIVALAGESPGAPATWMVKDGFGILERADIYLIKHGFAPAWESGDVLSASYVAAGRAPPAPSAAGGEVSDAHSQVTYSVLGVDLPKFPSLTVPGFTLGGMSVGTWALIGAFGLLAIVLVTRHRGPSHAG